MAYNPDYNAAEIFIAGVSRERVNRYKRYWKSIVPTNDDEYFYRWLFSFLSVRTQWARNIEAFLHVQKLGTTFTKQQLSKQLRAIKSGRYKVLTKGISKFRKDFFAAPHSWYKRPEETFRECRDRLHRKVHGLGIAKTAFVLEMTYPTQCQVACLDTHLLKLYGFDGSVAVPDTVYLTLEDHWVNTCRYYKLPPAMVRHIYWDDLRGEDDTRYWSFVFEKPTEEVLCLPKSNLDLTPSKLSVQLSF